MYLLNRNLPNLFDTFEKLSREFDDFNNNFSFAESSKPRFNLYRGKEGLILTAKLPGVTPEDLEISIVDQALTIKGEFKNETSKDLKFHRSEIKKGSFTRTLELPFRVETDKVEAEFKQGLLKIKMPQADADKPRKISVISK